MLGGLFIPLLTGLLAVAMINRLKQKYAALLKKLFYYHTFLFVVYFLYALFNPSDSRRYYIKVVINYGGLDWFSFYGTSTTFIEFVTYPICKISGVQL